MTRILIIAPAWVGDMVMAECLVSALRRREPQAQIDLLAPPWTAPLGERMEGVGTARVFGSVHGRFDLAKRVAAGRSLRSEKYDLAIVLPGSLKAAIPPLVAGIPLRRGYRGEMRYGLLNDLRQLDKQALPRTVDRFAALAVPRGEPMQEVVPPRLRHDVGGARAVARRLGLDPDARPVVALCPGAEYGPAKQWPVRYVASLAASLAARGYQCWIFGSPRDKPTGEEIVALASSEAFDFTPENLCGRTSLLEAVDLLGLATAVVTNDSGLMHVATAIGRPVVALYGSSTPVMTPPLGEQVIVLERDLPCRPCFERVCPLGHLDCLNGINPPEVVAALERLIGPPPLPAAA